MFGRKRLSKHPKRHGALLYPLGPNEVTLALGATVFDPSDVTEAGTPRDWANKAAEQRRKTKVKVARFTGSSYSRTAAESPFFYLLLDPRSAIWLLNISHAAPCTFVPNAQVTALQ